MGASASVAENASASSVTYSTILQRSGPDELFGLFVYGSEHKAPIVEKITPGSAAHLANPKLKVGSNILAVNGKRMIGAAAIATAIRAAPYPAPLVLEVEDPTSAVFGKQYRRVAKEANKRAARLASVGINALERALGLDLDGDGDVGNVGEPVPGTPRANNNNAAAADPAERYAPAAAAPGSPPGVEELEGGQPQGPPSPTPRTPGGGVAAAAGGSAPPSPGRHRAAASSFSVRVEKPANAPPTLGLVLAGSADEPPLVVDIPPDCLVATAWPMVHPGMRILAVNRRPVKGPAEAAMRSTESLCESGTVLLDVDDSHAGTAPVPPPGKLGNSTARLKSAKSLRSLAAVAPAPPDAGVDTGGGGGPPYTGGGGGPPSSSHRSVSGLARLGGSALDGMGAALDAIDGEGEEPPPPPPRERWGSLGLTVQGASAFEKTLVGARRRYEPGALASELGKA